MDSLIQSDGISKNRRMALRLLLESTGKMPGCGIVTYAHISRYLLRAAASHEEDMYNVVMQPQDVRAETLQCKQVRLHMVQDASLKKFRCC